MNPAPTWEQIPKIRSAFWAKSGDETGYLSLPQHLSDAGSVAYDFYDSFLSKQTKDFLKQSIPTTSELSDNDVRLLLSWLAYAHDIGKATLSFQHQIEKDKNHSHLWKDLSGEGYPCAISAAEQSAFFPHALASGAIVRRWLIDEGVHKFAAGSISDALAAHHGVANNAASTIIAREILDDYPSEWISAQNELLDAGADALGIRPILEKLDRKKWPVILTQLITGIVVCADWCASNADAFPMSPTNDQPSRTRDGLKALGLTKPWEPSVQVPDEESVQTAYAESFNWPSDRSVRPIQEAVVEAVKSTDGPTLLIIEAPTGEGKTEAALQAATYLSAKNGSQGVVIAAPTMATANGLYQRVSNWAEAYTDKDHVYSMYLAHSKNSLNQDFQQLRLKSIGEDKHSKSDHLIAADWFRGNRKGLLSNFVVATVDQVLMIALQMRYSMIRHVALAGKTIIIDEVHAYSTYTNQYLETALSWLAKYGASVILLSATLPVARRQALASAYGTQISKAELMLNSQGYPLVSAIDSTGVKQFQTQASSEAITSSVEIIDDEEDTLVQILQQNAAEGGCFLVICNTIKRAQAAFTAINEAFPNEAELHHSAFTAHDRAKKERGLLAQLGPTAHRESGRPFRRFIVGTQVLEQSLDIDADLLITDVCPIDLFGQRIGRVYRHQRPESDRPKALRRPRVFVRGIHSSGDAPEFDQGTSFIYERSHLIRALSILISDVVPNGFTRPSDLNELVQKAYADEFHPINGWKEELEKATATEFEHDETAIRNSSVCRMPRPQSKSFFDLFERVADTRGDAERAVMHVRDIAPSFECLLVVCHADGTYSPLGAEVTEIRLKEDEIPNHSQAVALIHAEIRLPAKFAAPWLFSKTLTDLEKSTPTSWNKNYLLRNHLRLVFDEDLTTTLAGRKLKYSTDTGLFEIPEAGL